MRKDSSFVPINVYNKRLHSVSFFLRKSFAEENKYGLCRKTEPNFVYFVWVVNRECPENVTLSVRQ